MLLKILWYKLSYLIFTPLDPNPNKKLGAWIRIHMDIFGILDPDSHEILCRSETLIHSRIRLRTKMFESGYPNPNKNAYKA